MKVLIVDDHRILASSLSLALRKHGMNTDIGVTTKKELAAFIGPSQPDIVLIDVHLGENDGFEVASYLLSLFPELKIIFFSGFDFPYYIKRAKKVGGKGFLRKSESLYRLIQKIQAVHDGETFFEKEKDDNPHTDSCRLTEHQIRILQYLSNGASRVEIAKTLSISEKTVHNHIQLINEKLKTNSYVKSVVRAIELGFVKINL